MKEPQAQQGKLKTDKDGTMWEKIDEDKMVEEVVANAKIRDAQSRGRLAS